MNTALAFRLAAHLRTGVLTATASDSLIVFALASREIPAESVRAQLPAIRTTLEGRFE